MHPSLFNKCILSWGVYNYLHLLSLSLFSLIFPSCPILSTIILIYHRPFVIHLIWYYPYLSLPLFFIFLILYHPYLLSLISHLPYPLSPLLSFIILVPPNPYLSSTYPLSPLSLVLYSLSPLFPISLTHHHPHPLPPSSLITLIHCNPYSQSFLVY